MQDTIKNFKSKLFLHISHIMLNPDYQNPQKHNIKH